MFLLFMYQFQKIINKKKNAILCLDKRQNRKYNIVKMLIITYDVHMNKREMRGIKYVKKITNNDMSNVL